MRDLQPFKGIPVKDVLRATLINQYPLHLVSGHHHFHHHGIILMGLYSLGIFLNKGNDWVTIFSSQEICSNSHYCSDVPLSSRTSLTSPIESSCNGRNHSSNVFFLASCFLVMSLLPSPFLLRTLAYIVWLSNVAFSISPVVDVPTQETLLNQLFDFVHQCPAILHVMPLSSVVITPFVKLRTFDPLFNRR
ncbi:ABC transporter, permease protein [Sesbania bispinosa]|nr:ABC transporter, permease protein [Sesbania bispinosa]